MLPHSLTVPRIHVNVSRHRPLSDQNFEDTEVEELIAMLRETENLEEQGDILQYLVDTQGLDFNTGKSDLLSFSTFTQNSNNPVAEIPFRNRRSFLD